MQTWDRFYRISPKIVQTGKRCRLCIDPLFEHVTPPADVDLRAHAVGRDSGRVKTLHPRRRGRTIEMGFVPSQEQEYKIVLSVARAGDVNRWEEFPIYAVDEDLFSLRPWKGDMHMHSSRSDGLEEPVYVAAACRRIGLDFMALTDHHRYAPSVEARDAFAELALDFRIYPGEEIHPPGNPVHMVNFGGSIGVNIQLDDHEAYEEALSEVLDDTREVDLAPEEQRILASCRWTFDRIRDGDGIGILCHPYWLTSDAHNISESLQAALYDMQPFDALEVIGGYHRCEMESNALAVARWQEERSRGRRIPVVGVSDAHGCETGDLFGWYYSLVFAPTPDYSDLHEAILDERSVAVEAVEDDFPRLAGPFRFVKFSYFLLREVLPIHDEYCAEEGHLMYRFLIGDTDAEQGLRHLQGRVKALYDRFWGN